MCVKKANGKYPDIQGNWEERGVIGSRVEIEDSNIVFLWRGGPVLETTFKVVENGDGSLTLKLAKTGLRYKGDTKDYASIADMTYADGKLTMTEYFPITGESKSVLSKTENTRFGNYDFADEKLEWLRGAWVDERGYNNVVFDNDKMTINGETIKVHVLKPRWNDGDNYLIRNADPSRELPSGLSTLEIKGGRLLGRIIVCDAPFIPLVFSRKDSGEA